MGYAFVAILDGLCHFYLIFHLSSFIVFRPCVSQSFSKKAFGNWNRLLSVHFYHSLGYFSFFLSLSLSLSLSFSLYLFFFDVYWYVFWIHTGFSIKWANPEKK